MSPKQIEDQLNDIKLRQQNSPVARLEAALDAYWKDLDTNYKLLAVGRLLNQD